MVILFIGVVHKYAKPHSALSGTFRCYSTRVLLNKLAHIHTIFKCISFKPEHLNKLENITIVVNNMMHERKL